MANVVFEADRFWGDIERAVAREGVSWRGLASRIEVDPSTIAPKTRSKMPSIEVAGALSRWALVALDEYIVEPFNLTHPMRY